MAKRFNIQLKKTTESTTALSYLDIFITIENGKYSTSLYDKRDSYKFEIVNFPDMGSNVPSKPAYRVYISQLVRIQSYGPHYTLTEMLIRQGFRFVEKWVGRGRKIFT